NGFKNFYSGWSDYLPGYLYILYFLGKIKGFIPDVILYKLPAILADISTGFLIYKIIRKTKSEKLGLLGASIYIFNPAIIANSTLWGQVDSFVALFSLLAVYLLTTSYWLSTIFLAIGTLVKPQAAFILPVVLLIMIKEKWPIKKIFVYLLIGLFMFLGLFIPFWNHGNLFNFILERLTISANQYQFTSINAFNFWALFGFWKPDNFHWIIGIIVALLISTFAVRKNKSPYFLCAVIFSSSFLFMTRMHERHFLPALAFLAIAAIENPLLLLPYIGFSLTYVANLYYAYVWITNNFKEVFSDLVVKFISIANIIFLWCVLFPVKLSFKLKSVASKTISLPKTNLSPTSAKYFLIGILIFAFVTRTFNLWNPSAEYFDEVYHAFTARTMLHNDPKAWEWWNTPPEGFAYEWTHPPLAKLGMVIGMKIFGENAFGWRISGALLGVGIVYIVYRLGKDIFKDEIVGLLSAAVFSLDGLPLVLSRIGMNDSYLLFFALLSIYFFLKQKNFWSAVAFGLALASKWSAIWALPILFLLWLRRKNKFSISLFLSFIIFPISIYLLSYLPMFLSGHDLSIWWGMQQQMWWYHTGLRATHPYTSLWWSWPLLIRPIYLYTSDEIGGMVSRIYAMGNPIVFWFGFTSVIVCAIYSYLEKNKNLAFVVFSYLIFFVPWAASPRIMFLYHYLPSIPFLAIATGYVLRRNPKLVYWVFGIGLLVFIYFYPHWAGLQIPLWLDRSYYWVSSWR
ncbi:MAG TPA: glycosyltransferase family 39 protein, partial [Alphaproteobacteria bacterium]|nr:glycosyltransferase family 39 protein [Alphaproteobacteria bacterium]